jgi:hypothetical protein
MRECATDAATTPSTGGSRRTADPEASEPLTFDELEKLFLSLS